MASQDADAFGAPTPAILLADADVNPAVEVVWHDRDGVRRVIAGTRAYASDADRTPLGANLEAFVALGGSRLEKGAGHPRGAIVKAGFYKADARRPMFPGIDPGRPITVRLTGVRFNQPVDPVPSTVLQHLKYAQGDLERCAMPPDAREQFNTASAVDTLNGRTRPGIDARLGALSGGDGSLGSARAVRRDDGSIDLEVRFEYRALRNLRDPWRLEIPGTFLEPVHFHVELEVIPEGETPRPPVPVAVPVAVPPGAPSDPNSPD